MRFASTLVRPIVVIAALSAASASHAQSFEQLIEGVLNRHPEDQAPPPAQEPAVPMPGQAPPLMPPPGQLAPIEPAPGEASPIAPPPGQGLPPGLVPVEPGPRPYTPPKVDRPPEEMPAPSQKVTPTDAAPATPATPAPAGAEAVSADAVPATPAPSGPARTRESLTAEEVNAATLGDAPLGKPEGASPIILKLQILLDRAGASPGQIDAYYGGNLLKAISAVETVLGRQPTGEVDPSVWDALGGDAAPPVLVQYTITLEDLAYPFVPAIPADYAEQARLPNLNYTSPEEMFGERFHMDVRLLKALNPNADFRQAGTHIWVAAVDAPPIAAQVTHIVADRRQQEVRGYDAGGHIIVAYPATIGSDQNPFPYGQHVVRAVVPDPAFDYGSKSAVDAAGAAPFTLPPGPNNPLGSVWIDLTEPGYGIQGTAEPSRISKGEAFGCVWLTNWDAKELSRLVAPGVVVDINQ